MNLNVLHAEVALAELLCAVGAKPLLVHLADDKRLSLESGDLGVDDYLTQYGINDFKTLIMDKSWQYPLNINFEGTRGKHHSEDISSTKEITGDRLLRYLAVIPESEVLQIAEVKKYAAQVLNVKASEIAKAVKNYRQYLENSWKVQQCRKSGAGEQVAGRRHIDISLTRTFEERCQDVLGVLGELKVGYRMGTIPVSVSPGRPIASLADSSSFSGFLAEYLEFYTISKKGTKSFHLWPQNQVEAFLKRPSCINNFRTLSATSDLPVYDNNFRLLCSGYDEVSGIYVTGESIVPSNAVFHIERLIGGLCYADDGSKTNRLGALLAWLMPTLFMGNKPLLLWQGNQPGIGKSWSAEVDAIVRTGSYPRTLSYTPDDSELEKQLAAAVLAGASEILIDNAKVPHRSGEIFSGVLERSITNSELNYRILGKSHFVSRPNSVQFALTANCPRLSQDLVSRSMPINLYFEGDPAKRCYSNIDPRKYAQDNRREIRGELMGMVERWKCAERPLANIKFRFSNFASVIGGILQVSGYTGFLCNISKSEEHFSSCYIDLLELLSSRPELKGPPKVFVQAANELGLFQGELQGKNTSGACRKMAEILGGFVGREFPIAAGEVVTLTAKKNSHVHSKIYAIMRASDSPLSLQSSHGNSVETKGKLNSCEDANIEQRTEESEIFKENGLSENVGLQGVPKSTDIFASSQEAPIPRYQGNLESEHYAAQVALSPSQQAANHEDWADDV